MVSTKGFFFHQFSSEQMKIPIQTMGKEIV